MVDCFGGNCVCLRDPRDRAASHLHIRRPRLGLRGFTRKIPVTVETAVKRLSACYQGAVFLRRSPPLRRCTARTRPFGICRPDISGTGEIWPTPVRARDFNEKAFWRFPTLAGSMTAPIFANTQPPVLPQKERFSFCCALTVYQSFKIA